MIRHICEGTIWADFPDFDTLEPLVGAIIVPGGGGGLMTWAPLMK